MIRVLVMALLLSLAVAVGYRWAVRRTGPVLAGLRARVATLEAEGQRLLHLVGDPPAAIVDRGGPIQGWRPVLLDPDTPIDELPDGYGADHDPHECGCVDCRARRLPALPMGGGC